jgi:hypothetical protein
MRRASTSPQDETNATWQDRHAALLVRLRDQQNWHDKAALRAFRWERGLASVVMACSILAPLAIASGETGGLSIFGLAPDILKKMSLGLTILLALAEGLRRIFRFDQRYALSAQSRERLRFAREVYVDNQIGLEVGSDDWKKNLERARQISADVSAASVGAYAESLASLKTTPKP